MPESCSAFGCTNRRERGGKLQFFAFPLNDQKRLAAWVHAVRRVNFKPSKYSRLCSEHFLPECYEVRPNINVPYLKKDAVPSVFKAFPPHLQNMPPKQRCRKRKAQIPPPSANCNDDEEPASKATRLTSQSTHVESESSPVSTPAPITSPRKTILRKKIKVLKQKVRRKEKKITSLKQLLKTLKKQGLLESDPRKIIEHHFDGVLVDLFENEMLNRGRTAKGHRYSKELKQFAFTLMYYSPRAYRFCRSILALPHPKSVRNWTSSTNAEPGFLTDVFNELKMLSSDDRDCNLLLDSMSSANCQALDSDSVGSIFEVKWSKRCSPLIHDEAQKNASESSHSVGLLHNAAEHISSPSMTDVKDNILFYICGYVVRKLMSGISCPNCATMLFQERSEHNYCHGSSYSVFVDKINHGSLVRASESVFKIVSASEKELHTIVNTGNKLRTQFLKKTIVHNIRSRFAFDALIFPNSSACPKVELGFDAPHKLQLLQAVCDRYLKIRLLSYGKFYTEEMLKPVSKRHKLRKLILFNNM